MKQQNSNLALLPLSGNRSKTDMGKGITLLPIQWQRDLLFDKQRKEAEETVAIAPDVLSRGK